MTDKIWFMAVGILAVAGACVGAEEKAALPADNPVAAKYGGNTPEWVCALPWTNVVNIRDFAGVSADESMSKAQASVVARGGGVVYCPAGTYVFTNHVLLQSGVIVRGETPSGALDATNAGFSPKVLFEFPRYKPVFEGQGTPNETAFKGIRLADPAAGRKTGIVFISINHGHVELGSGKDFRANFLAARVSGELLVFGCTLRHSAIPDGGIPMLKIPKTERTFQNAWQRWTHRHHAAIEAFGGGNVFIANNRIPASGEDSFAMKGYVLAQNTTESEWLKEPDKLKIVSADVTFDYDNRPGISVNYMGLNAGLALWDHYVKAAEAGTNAPSASQLPPHPAALAKGIVICDNFVYCSGCTAIRSTGDGTFFLRNTIRYPKGLVLPTARGYQLDHFTNNNRAIEVRGWRWTMEGNDYEVYSNLTVKGGRYGDGEGLMHEAYDNIGLVDSKFLRNRGNAYLCVWRVPVEGLTIEGNHVDAIKVLCLTNKKLNLPCKGLRIVNNRTGCAAVGEAAKAFGGGGIQILGGPAADGVVSGNVHEGGRGKIDNSAGATVSDNRGYE